VCVCVEREREREKIYDTHVHADKTYAHLRTSASISHTKA
jgi:hypothetical protein